MEYLKCRKTALFFFALAGLIAGPFFGYSSPDSTIHVGIYQNPPKLYLDEKREPQGIFVDLLSEIARLEGWNLNYVPCQWNDCLDFLNSSKIDLLPDVAFSRQRSERFDFNKIPVLESWSQVYAAPGQNIEHFSELQGKRVATLKGSVQQIRFKRLMDGFGYSFREVETGSFGDAFSLVKIGVADVAIVNHFFGEMHFEKFLLKRTSLIFDPTILHFAVENGKNSDLLETIDRHLIKWKVTPQSFYYQTLNKHNEMMIVKTAEQSYRWYIFLAIGAAVLAGGIILILRKRVKKESNKLEQSNLLLQNEEKKFRRYFENSPFGILVADEKGNFVEVNPKTTLITGYTKRELIHKSIPDLIPETSHKEAGEHFQRVLTTGNSTGELPFITKKGKIRYWTVDAVKITDTRFIGFLNDITERKKIDTELRELKNDLEKQVKAKTKELNERITELEQFREATIERELRMEELRQEIKFLKEERSSGVE